MYYNKGSELIGLLEYKAIMNSSYYSRKIENNGLGGLLKENKMSLY
jgi:hypothetical protein